MAAMTPNIACWPPIDIAPLLLLLLLFPLPDPLPDPPVCDPPEAVAGADGVKVAEGLAKQEEAAALAFAMDDGAFLLIVAFPEKSHDWGLRLLAS